MKLILQKKYQMSAIVSAIIAGLVLYYVFGIGKNNSAPDQTVIASPNSINIIGQYGNNEIINPTPKPYILNEKQETINTPYEDGFKTEFLLMVANLSDSYKELPIIISKEPLGVIDKWAEEMQGGIAMFAHGSSTLTRIYRIVFITKNKVSNTDFDFSIKD